MSATKEAPSKNVHSIDGDELFRTYTRTERDPKRLILDVRDHKDFKKGHLLLAYNIRLTGNQRLLVDYSKNTYKEKWSQELWWNTDVIIYGAPGLKKDHPVCAYLAREGRCKSISILKEGLSAVQARYNFLCTLSTKAHQGLIYPSQVEPGVLYLGDWDQALDTDRLQQLKIRRIITIHNHPERLKTPSSIKHMRIEAADVPTTDVTRFFNAVYEFIEDGRSQGTATLVHCGAGVSRSTALCASYLMRKNSWNAHRSLKFLVDRRSKVCPNEGFWRQLCALEAPLSIPVKERSDLEAPPVVDESFGQLGEVVVATGAAGHKLDVTVSAVSRSDRDAGGSDDQRKEKRSLDDAAEGDTKRQKFCKDSQAALVIDIVKDGAVQGKLQVPTLRRHQRCIFGRGPDCSVKLEHASISRQHAALTVDATGAVHLMDLGSGHGTNVNGLWVKAQQPKNVQVGAHFRFGASSRTYTIKAINVTR